MTGAAPVGCLSRRAVMGGLMLSGMAAQAWPALVARPTVSVPLSVGLQSLGWWMRRPRGQTIAGLMPYYQQVLGLPLLRSWQSDLVLLWAGEDHVFEVKTDDNPARDQSDPASAALLPVFRVNDLALWRARMARYGYQPVASRASAWGETLFYRGPDDLVMGFEQRRAGSPFAADARAQAAFHTGPFRLGGLPALPDGLHYLGRAIRQVADVAAMTRFYRDRVGLAYLGEEAGSQCFALGTDAIFEIAPGGVAIAEPDDRSRLPDSFVLRVHDLDEQELALPRRGVRLKGSISVKEETTRLQFVPDPEGWIFGIEERDLIRDRYIDDVEADRRWRAGHAP